MKIKVRRVVFLCILISISLTPRSPLIAASNGACTTPTQTSLTEAGTTYTVQKFTTAESNCTWTVPAAVTWIETVIVGGGGGAAFGSCGGGGGAGRVIVSNTRISVSPGSSVTLTIGGGGAGGWVTSSDWRMGTSGYSSSLTVSANTYTASGGGGGGGGNGGTAAGLTGGSGGGGSTCSSASGGSADTSVISGFTGYANAGAAGGSSGGGGGGAGGSGSTNGNGGAGITLWGDTFAGGGGGWQSGTGGTGGGGSALTGTTTKAASGNPGTSGTGSGGGGGNNGGSGRIMIRYIVDTFAPIFNNLASFTATENVSSSTNIATISVSESATIVISAGVDSATFTIVVSDSVTARVRFNSPPDFEGPTDSGGNNIYDLTLRATDPFGNTATQAITITVTNLNESSTINAPTVATIAYKGQVETITVTVNAPGKIRFFVGGKRISTCLARLTSGSYPNYSATCYWKPPVTGRQLLTAAITPSDNTFSANTSAATVVSVVKRTSVR